MAVVPKGNRLLGMDIQPASNNDYGEAFQIALTAGTQVVPLTLPWNYLEPSLGVYNLDLIKTINIFYPGRAQVSLAINVISTGATYLPTDLVGRAWNDPLVIARYQALCNAVLARLPNVTLAEFIVGNEVDATLGSANTWVPFGTFLSQVSAYIKQFGSAIPCGITATLNGYITYFAQLSALQTGTDFIGITYYAINPDYTVKSPTVVSTEWGAIIAAFPGRLFHFRECGYPSSAVDNSNELLQSSFISNVFSTWDTYASVVTLCSFLRETDYSLAKAQQTASNYYLNPTTQFVEYLRTLGLRNLNDTDKPAWGRLQQEAHARGW